MTVQWIVRPPREVVLEMLGARFGTGPVAPGAEETGLEVEPMSRLGVASTRRSGLAPFQAQAVERLRAILDHRRGAVLADSVGLGKTHVARAIIRDFVRVGARVLVCGPAALRSHWRRHLRGVEPVEWLSHTALSRGASSRAPPALIVVDEAHAFRNPATRRYHRLAALCSHARVLLLTATPVNNSILDFYHLLRLFSARHDFSDVGVTDLLTAVETANHDPVPLRRVVDAVVVRRTRELIEQYESSVTTTPHAPALSFPRREHVRLLHYDLALVYPGLIDGLSEALGSLRFPAHSPTVAYAGPARPGVRRHAATPAELMRLGLLKRLESSPAAFAASVLDYARMLRQFVTAAEQGMWLDVRRDRGLYRELDGAVQLALDRLALAPWPASLERGRMLDEVRRELDVVDGLLLALRLTRDPGASALGNPIVQGDPKLWRLEKLLDNELRNDQVLIFTEFRETARLLWQHLVARGGVAMIHGGEARLGAARAGRGTVIRRFAPLSNGVPPPRQHESVRILIATDVLAEGLNLQDARAVVSYDVPWNPVRLAQRIGRIDRLGSPHDSVVAYAFRPDRNVDAMLGLVRRVRRKLRDIDVVGGDAPLLGTRRTERDPRGSAPDTGVHRDGWSISERLRLEYATSLADSPAAGTGGVRRKGVAAAAASGAVSGRVAVVVLSAGTGVHCAAVRLQDRGGRSSLTVELDTEAVDELLLAVLQGGNAPAAPDMAWLATAVRAVRRHVRDQIAGRNGAPGAAPPDRALRSAARAIRRWLVSRPGGASAEEVSRADRLLSTLAQCDTAMALRIADLVRAGVDDEALIWQLRHLMAGQPRPRSERCRDARRDAPARLDIIAALDVMPLVEPAVDG